MQEENPRRVDRPVPGHFRIRLVRGGWAVPAMIEESDGLWRATIDGRVAAWVADPLSCADLARVWHYGREITAWHYQDLLALKARAAAEQPGHPCLHPERAMHPITLPVVRRGDLIPAARALLQGIRR